MLKIQVLGKGLIPRGYGLAPRKELFFADLTLIYDIMRTPGLQVKMQHPDGRMIVLTRENAKKMYEAYANYKYPVKNEVAQASPAAPEEKKDEEPVAEDKKEEVKEPEKVETPVQNQNNSRPEVTPSQIKEAVNNAAANLNKNNQSSNNASNTSDKKEDVKEDTKEEKTETKNDEKKDDKKEDSKTNSNGTLKPVNAPEKK